MGVRLEVALATLVFVALVATTSGCRTTCMADDEASQDQIAKEKRAAGRAQTVCKELQRPRIQLEDDRVVLIATREVVVGRRGDVPAGSRFEPLYVRLERYRRHYRAIWPADPFEGVAEVALDPDLEAAKAASVVGAVTDAGYRVLDLKAGAETAHVDTRSCGFDVVSAIASAGTAREVVAALAARCRR